MEEGWGEEEEEEEDGCTPPTRRCRPVSFFDFGGKNGVAADVVGENIAMINIFELNGS